MHKNYQEFVYRMEMMGRYSWIVILANDHKIT